MEKQDKELPGDDEKYPYIKVVYADKEVGLEVYFAEEKGVTFYPWDLITTIQQQGQLINKMVKRLSALEQWQPAGDEKAIFGWDGTFYAEKDDVRWYFEEQFKKLETRIESLETRVNSLDTTATKEIQEIHECIESLEGKHEPVKSCGTCVFYDKTTVTCKNSDATRHGCARQGYKYYKPRDDSPPNARNQPSEVSHTPASAASSTVAKPLAGGKVEERDGKGEPRTFKCPNCGETQSIYIHPNDPRCCYCAICEFAYDDNGYKPSPARTTVGQPQDSTLTGDRIDWTEKMDDQLRRCGLPAGNDTADINYLIDKYKAENAKLREQLAARTREHDAMTEAFRKVTVERDTLRELYNGIIESHQKWFDLYVQRCRAVGVSGYRSLIHKFKKAREKADKWDFLQNVMSELGIKSGADVVYRLKVLDEIIELVKKPLATIGKVQEKLKTLGGGEEVEYDIHNQPIDHSKYIYGPVTEEIIDADTGKVVGERDIGWERIGDVEKKEGSDDE